MFAIKNHLNLTLIKEQSKTDIIGVSASVVW